MKEGTYEQTDYAAMCEGLTLLLNCLDDVLDSTGERDRLLLKNKEKVVEAYFQAKNYIPKERLTKRLRMTEKKVLIWAAHKKCEVSMLKQCFNRYTKQLTILEQDLLKQYLFAAENSHLPRRYIWAKARREGLLVSDRTFWKYILSFAGYKENAVKKKVSLSEQIVSKKPFEILHMDSTMVKCVNGERFYIHFIMDNYSRKILGAVPSYSSKSETVAMNLKQVISKHRLYYRDIKLYSDDGPENHGSIKEFLQSDKRILIDHIRGTFTKRTNNMIETFNYKFKYIILRKYRPYSFKQVERKLPEMIEYYNNLYLPVLDTLSPNEAIKGRKKKSVEIPYNVKLVTQRRMLENRQINCHEICPLVKPTYIGRTERNKQAKITSEPNTSSLSLI